MKFGTGFLIVIVGLIILFFFILLFDAMRLRRLRKKYKPDNDESRKGEQARTRGSAPGRSSSERKFVFEGSNTTSKRELLPTATSSIPGKDIPEPRESNRLAKLFNQARNRK